MTQAAILACILLPCLGGMEAQWGSFTIIISFPMVLIITIYSIPNKWKMLQVFYMGGSKVSPCMMRQRLPAHV